MKDQYSDDFGDDYADYDEFALEEMTNEIKIEESATSFDRSIDFREEKTDLAQAKDLLVSYLSFILKLTLFSKFIEIKNKVVPNFKLRWKLENEAQNTLKPNEKILYDLNPIQKIKCIQVGNGY